MKIFLRGFTRSGILTLLGICGLSIGLTSAFLVGLWVNDEFNFDSFHKKYEEIHRIVEVKKVGGILEKSPYTPIPLSDALLNDFPNLKSSTFIKQFPPERLTIIGENKFYFDIKITNKRFFDVFSFPFLQGNKETAFAKRNCVVLSEEVANKLFGDDNALGRNIDIVFVGSERTLLEVGAVVKVPRNSHIHFDILVPIECNWNFSILNSLWKAEKTVNYVVVPNGQGFTQNTVKQFRNILGKYMKTNAQIYLQPLRDVHLHTEFADPSQKKGNINYLILLTLVALFILSMAIVNFSNLVIGKSMSRLNEIGIKKVFGKSFPALVVQFLTETLLLVVVSFFLSLLMLLVLLPLFNNITEKDLGLNIGGWGFSIVLFVLVTIGIVTAGYPAFHLSSFSPVIALRRGKGPATKSHLMKILLAVQFAVAVILISSTLIIYHQLIFMQNKDLGFNRENIICVPTRSFIYSFEAIKTELLRNPGIIEVTASSSPIYDINFFFNTWSWEGMNPGDEARLYLCNVDPDYLKTYHIQLHDGAFLPEYLNMNMHFDDEGYQKSLKPFVINETAQKLMGFKNPIGKKLSYRINNNYIDEGEIVGVVNGFHFNSLHDPIQPLVLKYDPESFLEISIKTSGQNMPEILKYIDNVTRNYRKDLPFDYYILDDKYENIYGTEATLAFTLTFLTILSLFISVLGVLSQTTHTIFKRRKEVSIRKVYGAKAYHIQILLVKDFVWPLLLAFLVSIPAIYFFMGYWLNNFAYRINISLVTITVAGLLLFLISLLSVLGTTLRLSNKNPIKNLSEE